MKPTQLPILACLAVSMVTASMLNAATDTQRGQAFDRSPILIANISAGTSADAYLGDLVAALRAADGEGNGLDREDVARIEQTELERASAAYQSNLERARAEWLNLVNTDNGSVSLPELEHAFTVIASGRREVDAMFRQMDRNDDGAITLDDFPSTPRPAELDRFRQMDANGDGGISIDELIAANPRRQRDMPDAAEFFAKRDRNGDGLLSMEEALGMPPPPSLDTRENRQRRERFERVIAIDPNGDGRLTDTELTQAFTSVFNPIDTDGDGTISAAEYASAGPAIERARMIAEARLCPIPAPSASARRIAIAATRGQLLSGMALGSQDQVTSIIDLDIEPGAQPIQLILVSAGPVIWRLKGASERIEQVTVFGREKDDAGELLAGVTGLPQQRVSFAEPGCLSTPAFPSGRRDGSERLAIVIGAATGLTVEAVSISHGAGTIAVPSLSLSQASGNLPAADGFDPELWRDGNRSWPRGVETPDASAITSKVTLAPYKVLPGSLGTAQLIARGAIEPTKNYAEYRVLRPFPRFPAGMHGAAAASFVLPEGIPMPEGDQGHGCIYSEAGDFIGDNTFCRRSPRSDALTVQVRADGTACLYAAGGKEEACFPEDGRPLVVTETPQGRAIVPAAPESVAPSIRTPPKVPMEARLPVEIIPRVRR